MNFFGRILLRLRALLKNSPFCQSVFFLGYEMCERMSYYGIASNLVLYLTRELHEGTVKSANNVTNWAGFVWMAPILGAYIADAHLGRYRTFVIASGIYLLVVLNSLVYVNTPIIVDCINI